MLFPKMMCTKIMMETGQDRTRWDRTRWSRTAEIQKSKNQRKLSLGKMMKCEKCYRELQMKDLVHHFEFGVLLLPPALRTAAFGLTVLTNLHFFLKYILLGFRTLLVIDVIVCAGRVRPTCCFGIRFVGLVVMA